MVRYVDDSMSETGTTLIAAHRRTQHTSKKNKLSKCVMYSSKSWLSNGCFYGYYFSFALQMALVIFRTNLKAT